MSGQAEERTPLFPALGEAEGGGALSLRPFLSRTHRDPFRFEACATTPDLISTFKQHILSYITNVIITTSFSIEGRANKMAQRIEAFATKISDLCPGPTWWKERTVL